MAGITRVNGFAQYVTGTLYGVAQLKGFKIVVKDNSNTAVDLRTLDDGADEMVESVIREVQPLMYFSVDDNSGTIYVIVDGHAVDATTLQIRLREVVASKLGVASAGNDTTVELAVGLSMTV